MSSEHCLTNATICELQETPGAFMYFVRSDGDFSEVLPRKCLKWKDAKYRLPMLYICVKYVLVPYIRICRCYESSLDN